MIIETCAYTWSCFKEREIKLDTPQYEHRIIRNKSEEEYDPNEIYLYEYSPFKGYIPPKIKIGTENIRFQIKASDLFKEALRSLEKIVMLRPQNKKWDVPIGFSFTGTNQVEYGRIFLDLKDGIWLIVASYKSEKYIPLTGVRGYKKVKHPKKTFTDRFINLALEAQARAFFGTNYHYHIRLT